VGCNGYQNPANSYNSSWIFQPSTIERQITFLTFSLSGGSVQSPIIQLTSQGQTIVSYNPNSLFPTPVSLSSGVPYSLSFLYSSYPQEQDGYGFSANVWPLPTLVVSGHPVSIVPKNVTMVFFSLNTESSGALLTINVEIDGYTGLQNPIVYLSGNFPPTVATHQYENVTLPGKDPSMYTAMFNLTNPPDGTYWVSVYLTGPATDIHMRARWIFNFPVIPHNQKLQLNSSGTYQFFVPSNTPNLALQLAETVDGDNIVAVVTEGSFYDGPTWTILTNETTPYVQWSLNDPNPPNNNGPNPGIYFIKISCQSDFIVEINY